MPLNIIQRQYGKHGGAINDILLENERSFIILPCGNFYLLYSVKEYGTMRNFWFLHYPNTFSDKRETFLKSQKYLLMFPPSYNHFSNFKKLLSTQDQLLVQLFQSLSLHHTYFILFDHLADWNGKSFHKGRLLFDFFRNVCRLPFV